MWLLLILAVSVTNPYDIPGRVTLTFNTEKECLAAVETMTYSLKFDSFKVIAKCKKS